MGCITTKENKEDGKDNKAVKHPDVKTNVSLPALSLHPTLSGKLSNDWSPVNDDNITPFPQDMKSFPSNSNHSTKQTPNPYKKIAEANTKWKLEMTFDEEKHQIILNVTHEDNPKKWSKGITHSDLSIDKDSMRSAYDN
eukprot:388078_1